MEFGFSGKAFGNLLLILAFVAVITSFGAFKLLQKRGIDTTKRSVGLIISLSCFFVFIVIPFWLTNLTLKQKAIVTILALAVSVGNYFAIGRVQKVLREQLGDKKKN